jgi:hypothetical protein
VSCKICDMRDFSVFNIYAGRSVGSGSSVSVRINTYETDWILTINASGIAEFEGGNLRPSVQQLKALNLREGQNAMEIRVQGAQTSAESELCTTADLWLWNSDDNICVVDIDGTITKSDVRGFVATGLQGAVSDTAALICSALSMSDSRTIDRTRQSIMPTALSKDYVHDGVAEAISYIAHTGCRIFYLTARPITWVATTRAFLLSVGRGSGARMPEGALVTMEHPTARFLTVSHEEYKTRVLRQVAALFQPLRLSDAPAPPRRVPFVAGFGNHLSDVNAYAAAGIPPDRIFLIDRTSKLTVYGTHEEFQSYSGLLPALPLILPTAAAAAAHAPTRLRDDTEPPPRRTREPEPPPAARADPPCWPGRREMPPAPAEGLASGPGGGAQRGGRGGWGASLLGAAIATCAAPRNDPVPPPQSASLIAPGRFGGGGGGGGGDGGGGFDDSAQARAARHAQGGGPSAWHAGGASTFAAPPRRSATVVAGGPRCGPPHGSALGPDSSAAAAPGRWGPGPAQGQWGARGPPPVDLARGGRPAGGAQIAADGSAEREDGGGGRLFVL